MPAHSVNVGSSINLTASFLNAAGTAAHFNQVIWSSQALQDPSTGRSGGLVNIVPNNPPSAVAQITGVYPGPVNVMASPDTNQSVVAVAQVNVIDTSSTPVSGTIS